MKKMLFGIVVALPIVLSAELTNIQKGDASVKAFGYADELRKVGFDKTKIQDLCLDRIKQEKEFFQNKTDEYTQLFFDKCIENLKK